MKYAKIPDKDGKGFYTTFSSGDFEYVDPVRHYLESAIMSYYFNKTSATTLQFPNVPPELFEGVIKMKSISWGNTQMKQVISTSVPDKLFKIFSSQSKDEQENIFKGESLTPTELISFICSAYAKYGYCLSQYSAHHNPKGFEKEKLPRLAHKDESNKIISVGETSLSDGQIKHIIEERSVTVSKFLDKGDKWHCFFLTFKGLIGKETGAQPHLHYISHSWGLTRKYVIEQLKSKWYKLPPTPHILYYTER